MAWEREVCVGGLALGRMRSMAEVVRHKPEEDQHELEPVDDFEFDELPFIQGLVVRLNDIQGVNLRSVTDEQAKAELEYMERGVIYRKVRVPAQQLGRRIKKGVEDHGLGVTLTGLGLVGVGAVTAGLYKKYHRK